MTDEEGAEESAQVAERVSRRSAIVAALGLEPSIIAASAAMFSMGFAENLWRRFLPKYLEQLGAPVLAIGLFGTAEDTLDGLYQYPGGWVADRYGRRWALLSFIMLAAIGYAIYWIAPTWPFVFIGLVFVMAWSSMASPTLFAIVGDALPKEKRTVGFTVQSILKRVPIAIAPTIGGLLIAKYSVHGGVRLGLVAAIVIALLTLGIAARLRIPVVADEVPINIRDVWRSFPSPLRWLLASDVFIRACDALVDVFLVLYAINVVGIGAPRFGVLVAVQATTAILAYFPAARLADRTGRKPFVIATFVAFALFPLSIVWARSFAWLVLAFVVGGLRELGEPARKAIIVDLATPALRARSIGLYYLIRSLAIAPSAFIGGLLWRVQPQLPFYVAGALGLVGVAVFVRTVEERYAG
ncbi:MAG: MFS transporter [Gemmatimonadota bacterium]|nr:MFS transporter [Gemmatimonadota bacterium]